MMMKPLLLSAACFAGLFLTGCTQGFETRPIASVGVTGNDNRLPDPDVEKLFNGVFDLLLSHGFGAYGSDTRSLQHNLYGSFYYAYFSQGHYITCDIRFSRTSARIDFSERESHPNSLEFLATEKDRAAVRALAREIETYLWARLPSSFEVRVSFHDPKNLTS
jgi:hypothetical protein